jgi:hypothetical protein
MQTTTKSRPLGQLASPTGTLLAGVLLAVGLSGCSIQDPDRTTAVSDPVPSVVAPAAPEPGTPAPADDTCNPGGGCPR